MSYSTVSYINEHFITGIDIIGGFNITRDALLGRLEVGLNLYRPTSTLIIPIILLVVMSYIKYLLSMNKN